VPANYFVMPGLVPGIHVFAAVLCLKTWMAGTSPAMTEDILLPDEFITQAQSVFQRPSRN
jgi:hypothetical protein